MDLKSEITRNEFIELIRAVLLLKCTKDEGKFFVTYDEFPNHYGEGSSPDKAKKGFLSNFWTRYQWLKRNEAKLGKLLKKELFWLEKIISLRPFSGSFVPLVTPFSGDKVDFGALKRLIEFHLEQGTDGFVPCGTTGESATLTHEEHRAVVKFVIEEVAGRKPVVAGCGSNATEESLGLLQYAKEVGADAALVITPYYNKPTQEGLYEHFKFLAERVELPIILYNVPGRTGVNLLSKTVAHLAQINNIVGLKEASGSIDQVSEIINLAGSGITLLCGEDSNLLPILSVGGRGSIAATANVAPADFSNLIKRFNEGNLEEARVLHHKLFPLAKAMFIETNPVPVKTALNLMGMISAEVRLPLVPLLKESLARMKEVLKDYGLI